MIRFYEIIKRFDGKCINYIRLTSPQKSGFSQQVGYLIAMSPSQIFL